MKTKISTLLTLVLFLEVPVNAQTQSLAQNTINTKHQTPTQNTSTENRQRNSKKILANLDALPNKHSAEYEVLAIIPKETATKEYKIKPSTISALLKLADDINAEALKLREQAKTKKSEEKKKLISKARTFEEEALYRQLEASELSGQLSQEQFNYNKIQIKILITHYSGQKSTLIYSYTLIQESEKDMKLAKELREEAYAQATLASRLGNLSNAEEKELLALSKQNTVIEYLTKTH